MKSLTVFFLASFVLHSQAFALTTFEKMSSVLNHFGAPEEKPRPELLAPLQGKTSFNEFVSMKKYFDPANELSRYLSLDANALTMYLDKDARVFSDTTVYFSPQISPDSYDGSAIDPLYPLAGKKIALDPGHMGGKPWDVLSGKFVEVGGAKVSEGEIAFITAWLASRKMQALGADVYVTRKKLEPLSGLNYENFDVTPFAKEELNKVTDTTWFEGLLKQTDDLYSLYNLFQSNSNFKKLFYSSSRYTYFFQRDDLRIRSERINAFEPDLTLFVHFDAAQTNSLQKSKHHVKVYVPGNIMRGEASSRSFRYEYLSHMLSPNKWVDSVALSSLMAQEISAAAGVDVENDPHRPGELLVSSGVYARNLALNRAVQGVSAYLECLHYDHPEAFYKLAQKDRHTNIEGLDYEYSSLLDSLSDAIVKAVVRYHAPKPVAP